MSEICKLNEIYDKPNKSCVKQNSKRGKVIVKARNIDKIHKIRIPKSKERVKKTNFEGTPLHTLIGMLYLSHKFDDVSVLIPINLKKIMSNNFSHEDISLRWNEKQHKIKVPSHFWKYLNAYLTDSKRFIVFPFGFTCTDSGHANYIIYDKKDKCMERFEPYGTAVTSCINKDIDKHIQTLFTEKMGNNFVNTYFQPLKIDNYTGFQTKQSRERKFKKENDPDGFCTAWSIWYTDLRLSNPDKNRNELIYMTIIKLLADETSFTDFIRDYADMIVKMKTDFIEKNYDSGIFSKYV